MGKVQITKSTKSPNNKAGPDSVKSIRMDKPVASVMSVVSLKIMMRKKRPKSTPQNVKAINVYLKRIYATDS